MVRHYKRKLGVEGYLKYDPATMTKALAAITAGMSTRQAARAFGVPNSTLSTANIQRYKTSSTAHRTAISPSIEQNIAQYIMMAACDFRMDGLKVRHFVKDCLNKAGTIIPSFKNNLPGYEWWRGFAERHNILSHGKWQNTSWKGASVEEVYSNFGNSDSLQECPPQDSINDDVSMTLVPHRTNKYQGVSRLHIF
jgi:hypothetical protein